MKQAEKDLLQYLDSIPYGNVTISIQRERGQTRRIFTVAEETLRYVDNEEAKNDLLSMIDNLTQTGFTGEANVKLTMKGGQIELVSIFNKKETEYKK